MRRKLKVGGVLHMATDWEPYAEHMLDVMSAAPGYRNQAEDGRFVPRPQERPVTKFERRGSAWDMASGTSSSSASTDPPHQRRTPGAEPAPGLQADREHPADLTFKLHVSRLRPDPIIRAARLGRLQRRLLC